MPKQGKPKPPPKAADVWRLPGSSTRGTNTMGPANQGNRNASGMGPAKKATAAPKKSASGVTTKSSGSTANNRARRAKAVKDRALKAAASDRARANANRKTPEQVKAVKQENLLQQVANKRAVFTPTESDPLGWKSIAAALGDAGDARFAKYKTGRRGSSAANAYIAGNKAKNKGPS